MDQPSSSSSSKPNPKELDKPQINSSKYEAYAIQNAIHKLANVRSEVEAEVFAALCGPAPHKNLDQRASQRNYIAAGSVAAASGSGSKRKGNTKHNTVPPTTTTQKLVQTKSKKVFEAATKKLNVPPTNKLYHDLLDLNVPPTTVKLKRAPQCEKKIDPSPCLDDYLQPKYCSIKPVRDYNTTLNLCKADEPISDICDDEDDDDEYYYLVRSEPKFRFG